MYYIKLLVPVLSFVFLAYCFIQLIYNKKKLNKTRLEMQEEGLIDSSENVEFINFINTLLWFVPPKKFRQLAHPEHEKIINKINKVLLALLLGFIAFVVITIFIN